MPVYLRNPTMRYLQLLTVLVLASVQALGQTGMPYVTDIPFQGDLKGSRIIDMVQDGQETMLFLTRNRILTYDGATWGRTQLPTGGNAIAFHKKTGRVFVALRDGFGELVIDRTGTYTLKSLSADLGTTDDYRTILLNDTSAMFIGEKQYVAYSLKKNEVIHRGIPDSKASLTGGLENRGQFFLNIDGKGAAQWKAMALKPITALATLADDRILFSVRIDSLRTLIGTDSDRLLIISGNQVAEVFGPVRNFVRDNFLSSAARLSDTTFALATLAGGIMVVESRELRPLYTYSYRTGLPDNEIAALCTDMSGGLWMAHEKGLSRIDLRQPVMDFSTYPGLEGSVQAGLFHRGQLFVGTSNGLFILSETADLKEIQRVLDRQLEQRKQEVTERAVAQPEPEPVKAPELVATNTVTESEKVDLSTLSKKEQRLLKRQQRKEEREKKKKGKEEDANEKTEPEPEPVAAPTIIQPETAPMAGGPGMPGAGGPGAGGPSSGPGGPKAPDAGSKGMPGKGGPGANQSLTHLYRKVSGIDGKCRQIVSYQDQILVATNTGLYAIADRNARPILRGYVVSVTRSAKAGRFMVATATGLSIVEWKGSQWAEEHIPELARQSVRNAIETKDGIIYMLTDFEVVRLTTNASGQRAIQAISLPVEQGEEGMAFLLDQAPKFIFTSGMYALATDGMSLVLTEVPNLERSGEALRFLRNNATDVWVNDQGNWTALGAKAENLTRYLQLFDQVLSISTDERGDLWVVDSRSHLYRIKNTAKSAEDPFNIYVRKVAGPNDEAFNLDDLTISHRFNSLEFVISAPYYLKSNGTEYQYLVEGLRDSWSRWSTNPVIEIPYLPDGHYKLHVRARNVFGQVSEEKIIPFTLEPKLWKRWYFILLYIVALGGIVLAVVKARERSLRETQRQLEEMVTNRTAELADEKRKVETLLLNILPKETADELQKKGKATARHYNMVSVLFTDFKGFTAIAEQTDPEDLVADLDRCFVKFDDIIERYGLEKIKTIGDSYMCAGGVPIRNKSNALSIVLAALEMRTFSEEWAEERRGKGLPAWEIRLGIHTGPLTAGVVGRKKFAYDIWGDTVNVASRMESASEAGKINISAATYEHIKHYFTCEPRGKIDTKGKGKMEMYFVTGINAKYSVNGLGKEPTKELLKILDEIW